MTIFVISDTHFQHENIMKLEFAMRSFSSVEEMDEHMVEKWNSVVSPGDKVYHLGDVMFGSKETFPKLWARLNGRKRLVVGNHDNVKWLAQGAFFDEIMLWRRFMDDRLILTHTPLHPSTLAETRFKADGEWLNVHGHIHSQPSPEGPYKCVCVEQVNYTPVALEEIRYG